MQGVRCVRSALLRLGLGSLLGLLHVAHVRILLVVLVDEAGEVDWVLAR